MRQRRERDGFSARYRACSENRGCSSLAAFATFAAADASGARERDYYNAATGRRRLMRRSPYSDLPASRFWKTAVAERTTDAEAALYRAKFALGPDWKIATAGSCFAQHIARHLKARGYNVLDAEPPPSGLSIENARRYGFGTYSGRYGNIYLVRQLLQLAQEAHGAFSPAEAVWERDGRYFDALRPAVEPGGFATVAEVVENRRTHLRSI